MKHFQLLFLIAIVALFAGCEKPDSEQPLPTFPVTYSTIDGAWALTEWNGQHLMEGTYLYIEFDSREHRFEMWDNLGSMYAQNRTGYFNIAQNSYEQYILSGYYDYGIGDWANEYVVSMSVYGEKMSWITDAETMIFSHIDSIPELN
jgi:hypothetical protein